MTWRFQQFEPQCAKGAFRAEQMTSTDWDAEVKMDGDRRIAQFCDDTVRFTGRKQSKKNGLFVEKTDNVPHLAHSLLPGLDGENTRVLLKNVRHLTGTVLDGEMMIDPRLLPEMDRGGRSKHVTSIMGSLPAEAVRKQNERGWVRYVAFDCLFYHGADLRDQPQQERKKVLRGVLREWGNPYVDLIESCPLLTAKTEWLEKLYARGEEGLILKDRVAPYGKAYQSRWVKVKNEISADAFIIGYKEPKATSTKRSGETSATKYAEAGLIGAVLLGQYRDGKVWECASISGMDEDLRARLSAAPQKFIRRVVRLKANGREPSGKFRHPVWDDFRDDKAHTQCVYDPEER